MTLTLLFCSQTQSRKIKVCPVYFTCLFVCFQSHTCSLTYFYLILNWSIRFFNWNSFCRNPRATFSLSLAGLLISLLMQLTDHFGPSSRCDADTQTISFASYGDSLGLVKLCSIHPNLLLCCLYCKRPIWNIFCFFFNFVLQLRRWKWLIRNMWVQASTRIIYFLHNRGWILTGEKLRLRHKQKWI